MKAIVTKNSNYLILIRSEKSGIDPDGLYLYNPGLCAYLSAKKEVLYYTTYSEFEYLVSLGLKIIDLNLDPLKFNNIKIIEYPISYEVSDEETRSGMAYECPLTFKVTTVIDTVNYTGYRGCPGICSISNEIEKWNNIKEFDEHYSYNE